MAANDVECEPSEDGRILWGIVLSGPVGILGEDNVEDPMQLVLAPGCP